MFRFIGIFFSLDQLMQDRENSAYMSWQNFVLPKRRDWIDQDKWWRCLSILEGLEIRKIVKLEKERDERVSVPRSHGDKNIGQWTSPAFL